MGHATYLQASFLGGYWSQTAQGDAADPRYKTALNTCLNGFPVATGAWTRRPGTLEAGFTRRGAAGRVIPFDFEEASPYDLEFTALYLRFWASLGAGLVRVTTNDSVAVSAISTASPAAVTFSVQPSTGAWPTGCTVFFSGLGTIDAQLINRTFIWTAIDGTHGTIVDEISGAALDGALLQTFTTGTINRVQELGTPYAGTSWQTTRVVQTETAAYLLNGAYAPQQLSVPTLPTATSFASFAVAPALFQDGPYLPFFSNGAQVTPNGKTGLIQLTLSFPAYVATTSYAIGSLVTSSSVNYQSLIDQNLGNTPASSPSDWQAVSSSAAINNGQGFLASDVGRLVRLLTEPAPWAVGTTYAQGNVVSYNPSGIPGQQTYWSSLVGSNTGNFPGTDITHWIVCENVISSGGTVTGASLVNQTQTGGTIVPPSLWTWGRIVSLLEAIPGAPASIAYIGDMTAGGGLSSAFDGNLTKIASAGAGVNATPAWIGQNFSSCSPSAYAVKAVTIFPSSDRGIVYVTSGTLTITATAYLYGANSNPATATSGTLLGTTFIGSGPAPSTSSPPLILGTSPVSLTSTDTTTTYKYLWVVIVVVNGATFNVYSAQVQFIAASGSGTGNGCTIELLGPALLYTNTMTTWQLGAYSNTTGWPTCGTFKDGRLWLSGVISNRVDACCANGISIDNGTLGSSTVNFAPSDQYGNVSEASAISYTFNSPGSNPIFWMEPDQQGIVAGTQGGEFLIYGPGGGGVSALNIKADRVTKIRCANLEPRRTEHTLVFAQAHQRKLVEYFPDVFSGKFTAPDLTEKYKPLTISGIAEIAYQQELVPTIWLRMNNGSLIGTTYKRDTLMTSSGPTFNGAHQHMLGSGNTVQSICAGPSEAGNLDALSLVTQDITTGFYHVECLGDLFEEGDPITQAQFVDSSFSENNLSYVKGSTSVVVSGLWAYNGRTMSAFLGGLDCGDFLISNGQITVPLYAPGSGQNNTLFTSAFVTTFAGAMPLAVGFNYLSQGQLKRPVEPADTGSRIGPAVGDFKRNHKWAATLISTQGIYFGQGLNTTRGHIAKLLTDEGDATQLLPATTLFSGIARDTITGHHTLSARLAWWISRPLPATVGNLWGAIETSEQ